MPPFSDTTEEIFPQVDRREQVTFKVGQQRLFGMLHLPLLGLPAPAVLICHGLAGDKTGRYRFYVHLAQRLAERGIACLRFDCRGSGDSEGDFHRVTVTSLVDDAIGATHYLQQHPSIDSARLGILGRSFGALVAVLAARRSQAFRTFCLWSALFDGAPWRDLWQQLLDGSLPPEKSDTALSFNGQKAGLPLFEELFRVDMPAELTHLDTLPLLHIHGVKDMRVDISHADRYEKCRRSSQTPSHFIRLPQGDHELSNLSEREEALEATLEWFRQTL